MIIRNVAAAIRGKEELIAPMEEGINGLELGNAMLLSGLTGETVNLPMDPVRYAAILAQLVASSKRPPKKVVKAAEEDYSASYKI